MRLDELVPMLQVAVGPVILVSGIGLLLLAMTNRFAHVTIRSREIASALRAGGSEAEVSMLLPQLDILARRAELIRRAIYLATVSLLLAAVEVIAIFVGAAFRLDIGAMVAVIFITCMLSLIASLTSFLHDINLSLEALKLEIAAARPH